MNNAVASATAAIGTDKKPTPAAQQKPRRTSSTLRDRSPDLKLATEIPIRKSNPVGDNMFRVELRGTNAGINANSNQKSQPKHEPSPVGKLSMEEPDQNVEMKLYAERPIDAVD